MIKCNAEFDNLIASYLSPLRFLETKVFAKNVVFRTWNEKKKEAIFDVFIGWESDKPIKIMEIRLKNLRQV